MNTLCVDACFNTNTFYCYFWSLESSFMARKYRRWQVTLWEVKYWYAHIRWGQILLLRLSLVDNTTSIPPSNNFSMSFGISTCRMSSVNCFIFFLWIVALDLHWITCRFVSIFPSSQHLHVGDIVLSNLLAFSSVYHCWPWCFAQCTRQHPWT